MRRARFLLAVTAAMLLSACAMNGGHPALAGADEPHATLQELLRGDIDDKRVRTKLVRVDGRMLAEGNRRTFLLEPGTHTLGFELDVESLSRHESGRGRHFPDPSARAADVREKSLVVQLDAGETYFFGGTIDDFNYAGWEPFVAPRGALD